MPQSRHIYLILNPEAAFRGSKNHKYGAYYKFFINFVVYF